MKGIILAGGAGTRLHPITRSANKHLLPVYNKPMIYYPLTTLMLAGIRDILIIVNPHDLGAYRRLFGDGTQWGLRLTFATQARAGGIAEAFIIGREFIGKSRVGLILGDNLFYGDGLALMAEQAAKSTGTIVFAYWVSDPQRYGVIEFDQQGRPSRLQEKPPQPRSNWAVTGFYFYDSSVCDVARGLAASARGELEITDVNAIFLERGELNVVKLGRGFAWLDTGTPQSLMRAAQFIEIVEERQGLLIGSPEEVAWRKGFIDDAGLEALIRPIGASEYGKYLARVLTER